MILDTSSAEVVLSLIGRRVSWIHAPSVILFEGGEIACSEISLELESGYVGITATYEPSGHPAWDCVRLHATRREREFEHVQSKPNLLGDYSSIVAPFGNIDSVSKRTFRAESGLEIEFSLRFSLSTGKWFEVGMGPSDIPVVGVYLGKDSGAVLGFHDVASSPIIR